MGVNDSSGILWEISNFCQGAFSGALIEVALCENNLEILSVIDNNLCEDLTNFLGDQSFYEECNILSQGIKRGEKSFSFEYTSDRDKRSIIVRAVYTKKIYKSQFPIFYVSIYDVTELKGEMEIDKKIVMNMNSLRIDCL